MNAPRLALYLVLCQFAVSKANYVANISIKAFLDVPMIFHNCTATNVTNITARPTTLQPSSSSSSSSTTFVTSHGKGFLGRTQGICYFTIPGSIKRHDPYPIGPYVHWCVGLGTDCDYFGFDTPIDERSGLLYGGAGCDYSYSPLKEMKTSMCVCAPGVSNAACLVLCNCSTGMEKDKR